MIIEGLLTTQDADGRPHVAPLGPVVDEQLEQWTLRPFKTSHTFRNLRNASKCCFHVTDDVEVIVALVLKHPIALEFTQRNGVWIIDSCCQWFELEIQAWDLSSDRTEASATVVDSGVLRPFWGWNRAKHALLEAAILMTRTHLLSRELIEQQLASFESPIKKTAGQSELRAWEMLTQHWQALQRE